MNILDWFSILSSRRSQRWNLEPLGTKEILKTYLSLDEVRTFDHFSDSKCYEHQTTSSVFVPGGFIAADIDQSEYLNSDRTLIEVENGFSPFGSSAKINCPPGTFAGAPNGTLLTGLKWSWECHPCPPNVYCPGDGKVHHCGRDKKSPAGTSSQQNCTQCEVGEICIPGKFTTTCDLGEYLQIDANEAELINLWGFENLEWLKYKCTICPRGHKCGFKSIRPIPCPENSYNSHVSQMPFCRLKLVL